MKNIQVLIISHYKDPGGSWAAFLSRRGWEVKICRSVGELLQAAGGDCLNFILFDEDLAEELPIGLAGKCGSSAPVILFSSQRSLPGKRISEYLQSGFDDYIEMDISPEVLEAKLLVNLRWALPVTARGMEEIRSRSGRIKVNKYQRTVVVEKYGGFSEISGLTQTELEILALLVVSEGAVADRRFIVENVWRGKPVNLENVDKHVEALRAKLADFGSNIRTVYGAGYCYREIK